MALYRESVDEAHFNLPSAAILVEPFIDVPFWCAYLVAAKAFLCALLCIRAFGFPASVVLRGAFWLLSINLWQRYTYGSDAGIDFANKMLLLICFLPDTKEKLPLPKPSHLLDRLRPYVLILLGASALLMLQLQVALVYLNAFLSKLRGDQWRNGTALYYVLQNRDYAAPMLSRFLLRHETLLSAMTLGVLAFQMCFFFLIWRRLWRPWLLASGLAFHVGGMLLMDLYFFGAVMLASYLFFIPDTWFQRLR